MEPFLEGRLQCPACGEPLEWALGCDACGASYDETDGIYDLVVEEPEGLDAFGDRAAEFADEEGLEDVEADYESFVSEAEQRARQEAGEGFQRRLGGVEGVTIELASGMGGLFGLLLQLDGVTPVATDISADALGQLKASIGAPETPHAYVACDARALPFRDGSVNSVVTAGGLNNIVRPERALAETARVLPEGGGFVGMTLLVDEGSPSAERAAELGVETAYLSDAFEAAMDDAGFAEYDVTVVSQAEATENPYDVLPIEGDVLRYALVAGRV